jgi:hypothetical protein
VHYEQFASKAGKRLYIEATKSEGIAIGECELQSRYLSVQNVFAKGSGSTVVSQSDDKSLPSRLTHGTE